jgi:uncharacterized protein
MPSTLTYPGVYVEEIKSEVRPIAGVSTSDTAFVGYFTKGPQDEPVRVTSGAEFIEQFGGPSAESDAAHQVFNFFANGGSVAWVVRAVTGASTASKTVGSLTVRGKSAGVWARELSVRIDHDTELPDGWTAADYFNLTIGEKDAAGNFIPIEEHRNVTVKDDKPRFVVDVVANASRLVSAQVTATPTRPGASSPEALTGGGDGSPETTPAGWQTGIESLDGIAPDVFNLLCLAGASNKVGETGGLSKGDYKKVVDSASKLCEDRRAFLIVDPPSYVDTDSQMATYRASGDYPAASANAAIYFPRLTIPDPLTGGTPLEVGPCGAVAGLFAATDAARGVWKAPAGIDATLRGVGLPVELNDSKTGNLNIKGINVLRSFPLYGSLVWGARTLKGADAAASEWKYIPVRRIALYIEESLYQGLKWVVFEPNDEPLWSSIRLNVGAFMNGLFRQGAFAGAKPSDAYFVKCDKDTTTQADVDRGICNILVGFSPLKPAEFVVLKIQQMAGQAEA